MTKAPEKPDPSKPPTLLSLLPMSLHMGDMLADEISEWRVIGRPFATAGGKTIHVRVEPVKRPGVTQVRAWGAHERVAVRRR